MYVTIVPARSLSCCKPFHVRKLGREAVGHWDSIAINGVVSRVRRGLKLDFLRMRTGHLPPG